LRFARTRRWGERRLGDEERSGDLGRGQPAERPQGQGDPGVHRQGRVTAGEDQPEPIVHDRVHRIGTVEGRVRIDRRELLLDQGLPAEELRLLREDPPPPEPIDRPVAGGRRDPGAGVVRHAPRRPRLEGRDEGLLDGFLGEVEVTEDADQGGHRPPLFLAEQAIDDGVRLGRSERAMR
jgi:hypothetical protein